MGHAAFSTLADRAVHVLGQFQHFNQICKLLHGKRIVVNAKVGEEQTGFLFFGAALVVHGILYAGFLFLDKSDRPMVALHWEKYLQHIVEKYNKIYRIQMPKVTPHVCRHTFCSNMAKSGMNPKTLQYIMGHSDISVTLNVYTHVQFDDAQAELLRVAEA